MISDEGIELVKRHEGCKLTSYPDPGTGGDPWTIGYGHTGPEVFPGLVITQAQADGYLEQDLLEAEHCIDAYVEPELTQGQRDALASFIFNLGCKAFKNSTMLKLLNANKFDAASQQFNLWTHADGRVLAGLVSRREDEEEMFNS